MGSYSFALLRSSPWRWSHQADWSRTGPEGASICSFLLHSVGDDGGPLEPGTWRHYDFPGPSAWLGGTGSHVGRANCDPAESVLAQGILGLLYLRLFPPWRLSFPALQV